MRGAWGNGFHSKSCCKHGFAGHNWASGAVCSPSASHTGTASATHDVTAVTLQVTYRGATSHHAALSIMPEPVINTTQ